MFKENLYKVLSEYFPTTKKVTLEMKDGSSFDINFQEPHLITEGSLNSENARFEEVAHV
jgi:hypothetical protein